MQKVGFDFVTFTSGTALALARLAKGSEARSRRSRARPAKGWVVTFALSLDDLKALEQRLARRQRRRACRSSRAERLACGHSLARHSRAANPAGALPAILAPGVRERAQEGLVVNYFAHRDAGLAADLPERSSEALPQPMEVTTADDPGRWRRRACASGPQVHQYIPVRFSALLASSPACRPDAKGHCNRRFIDVQLKLVSSSLEWAI